jgi:hypothetical protein
MIGALHHLDAVCTTSYFICLARPCIYQTRSPVLRLLSLLSTLILLASTQLAAGQAMVGYADPSQPEYWARTVGFWMNAERLCGVQYDPKRREALTAEHAAQAGVSVGEIKRMAVSLAAEAAPHFTDLSCQQAHNQAGRLGLYAPGAKTRPYEEVTVTEMLEEAAKTQPQNNETASYTLELINPKRHNIIRVGVVGGEVEGGMCGGKASCTRTVILPKRSCGGDIRLQMNDRVQSVGVNWCQSGGTVQVKVSR